MSEAFLDDATLEQQLQQEWAEEEDDGGEATGRREG